MLRLNGWWADWKWQMPQPTQCHWKPRSPFYLAFPSSKTVKIIYWRWTSPWIEGSKSDCHRVLGDGGVNLIWLSYWGFEGCLLRQCSLITLIYKVDKWATDTAPSMSNGSFWQGGWDVEKKGWALDSRVADRRKGLWWKDILLKGTEVASGQHR